MISETYVLSVNGKNHEVVDAAVGREITTIEGLGEGDEISDVQQAFVEAGAVQCGFCTPGLLVTIDQMLDVDPDPDELTVR